VTTLAIIAAVLCALVAVGLAIWLIPGWQVDRWRRAGISDEEKLAELGVQARSSITQALGGLALIVTIAISAYQVNASRDSAEKTFEETRTSSAKNLEVALENLALARQGQVSERFSRAVEQLGETDGNGRPARDVRTGALFSVMRIGIDSEPYTQPALLIVATYVRTHFAPPTKLAPNGCKAHFEFTQEQPDVANALGVVLHRIATRLRKKDKEDEKDKEDLLGLRGANLTGLALDGLNLSGFDLTGVRFSHASLVRAKFRYAKLNRANFEDACLIGADFTGASVSGAKFKGATLTGSGLALLSKAQKAQLRTAP
jgi:hypothetical protein